MTRPSDRPRTARATTATDIKPWFGGQVAFAVPALPSTGSLDERTPTPGHGAFLRLGRPTPPRRAPGWSRSPTDRAPTATYGDVALTVFGTGDPAAAVGVDGTILIGGDVATVHAIIDAKGADGLASTADYQRALANTPKDRVGFVFTGDRHVHPGPAALMPSGAAAVPTELLDRDPGLDRDDHGLRIGRPGPRRRRTEPDRAARSNERRQHARGAPAGDDRRRIRDPRRRDGDQGRRRRLPGDPGLQGGGSTRLSRPSTRSAGSTRSPHGSATRRRRHARRRPPPVAAWSSRCPTRPRPTRQRASSPRSRTSRPWPACPARRSRRASRRGDHHDDRLRRSLSRCRPVPATMRGWPAALQPR